MKKIFFIFLFCLHLKAQIIDIGHIAEARVSESLSSDVKKYQDSIRTQVLKWIPLFVYFTKTTGKMVYTNTTIDFFRPDIKYTQISDDFFKYSYPKELSTVWGAIRHPINTTIGIKKRKVFLEFLEKNYILAQVLLLMLLEEKSNKSIYDQSISTTKTDKKDEILVEVMQLYTAAHIYEKICQTTKLYSSLIRRETEKKDK